MYIYIYIYIHAYTVYHRGPINGDKVELYDVKGPVLKGRRIFPPLMADRGILVFKPFEQVIWGNLAENLIRTGAKLV